MRPPEFTGGNVPTLPRAGPDTNRFNEAAGIHRRKPSPKGTFYDKPVKCFNEAAGIHRRKPIRCRCIIFSALTASMRPPEFTGGNPRVSTSGKRSPRTCFNEAAGIHRRKPW